MNIEELKKHLDYIKNDKYSREFYVALLLYDILDVSVDELTEDMVNKTFEIQDKYDSIYNEDLRDSIRDEIDFCKDYSMELEEEEIEKE